MAQKKIDLNKIRYLAFEGGGGKGMVYSGALKAMEDLIHPTQGFSSSNLSGSNLPGLDGVVPQLQMPPGNPVIDLSSNPHQRKIKGVSGASAGAVTAFMVAMGMTSKEIYDELNDTGYATSVFGGLKLDLESIPITGFESFIEDPDLASNRTNDPEPKDAQFYNYHILAPPLISALSGISKANIISALVSPLVDDLLLKKIIFTEPEVATVANFRRVNLGQYLHGLLFNRGVFSGIKVREYLAFLLDRYLIDKVGNWDLIPINASSGTLSFKEFFNATGVDLVITGTNLTKHTSKIFSVGATPDFPVVEAVGLSMSIPILFRPVQVNTAVVADLPLDDPYNEAYRGLWADGGMLHNYPLHVFDELTLNHLNYQGEIDVDGFDIAIRTEGESHEFNEEVLGFRVSDFVNEPYDARVDYEQDILVIGTYLGQLLETLMFAGDQGQIRSIDELRRTIHLDSGGIGIADFTGPLAHIERGQIEKADMKLKAIEAAYNLTKGKLWV